MMETPHVIVGAALAAKLGNPLLAIPLSFISHFVLDRVPHWNPHIGTERKLYGHVTKKSLTIIVGDVALALILGTTFSIVTSYVGSTKGVGYFDWWQFAISMLCCFAAVLPDVIEAPLFFTKYRSKFLEGWLTFQKSIQNDTTFFWGVLTQAITIAASIIWIYS